jgi:hypothetical protein
VILPGNYCTHAIDLFNQFEFRVDTDEVRRETGLVRTSTKTIDMGIDVLAQDCARLMHLAEKFVMPDWGRIFDKEELAIFEDMEVPQRLPYPVIACEFSCDYKKHMNLGPDEMPSSRRIALMVEGEALASLTPRLAHIMLPENQDGFMVMPISYFDQKQIWTPPPAVGWMKREDRPQDFKATPMVTPLGLSSYSIYPESERLPRAVRDFSDEVITCTHLLLALAMDRTTLTRIEAPAKLNKKRERNKKPLLYEYKVLDIVADIMEAPSTVIARPRGNHASPRLHKRRGHVRRLQSGRVTWVRNTIVGKPGRGEVRKDYTVHK